MLRSIRNVKLLKCVSLMFITAVCILFLVKLRWPKNKSLYERNPGCENSDFLFRATCVIIKNSFSQNNSSALKAKIPVRSAVQSAVQSAIPTFQAIRSWFCWRPEGKANFKNVEKEAKMPERVTHPKIAEFQRLCSKPLAIMTGS